MAIVNGTDIGETINQDDGVTDNGDTINGLGGSDLIFGLGGDDSVFGGDGADEISGGFGRDSIYGGAGVDILRGEFDDTLTGGANADTLFGGEGIDTASYEGSAGGVTVNLASGTGSGGDADGDTLYEIENLKGSGHADTIIGNALDNRLTGGGGADNLQGGLGNDTYFVFGSDGATTVITEGANAGIDELHVLFEDSGSVTLPQNVERLVLTSLGETEVNAKGTEKSDFIKGDGFLPGGDGGFALRGLAGNDTLIGADAKDELYGGADNDALRGNGGDDTLDGGSDSDTLKGDAGKECPDRRQRQGQAVRRRQRGPLRLRFDQGERGELEPRHHLRFLAGWRRCDRPPHRRRQGDE
jgi:Ca2+-binding RTX toxin-like protein